MVQVVVMCDGREAAPYLADKSGDHYHGDVLAILPDYAVTDHYHQRDPFLVISVDCLESDIDYLFDPLTEQVATDDDAGEVSLLRKRYGLQLDKLPDQKYAQLMGSGTTSVGLSVFESIIESRSL